MSPAKIYCLNLMSDWKVLEDALALGPKLEMELLSLDPEEALYEIKELSQALIFVIIKSENDLKILLRMKEAFKREMSTVYKFVVVKFFTSSLIQTKIEKLGYKEIVDPVTNPKMLRHKIDRYQHNLSKTPKAAIIKTAEAALLPKSVLKWEDASDNFDDFWVLSEDKCIKVFNRFSIKLSGPGPYVGRWAETGKNEWKFEINKEGLLEFLPLGGTWTFSGELRPEFVWNENIWSFAGEELCLKYHNVSEGMEDYKFIAHQGVVTARENSKLALNRERVIRESFEKNLMLNREKEVSNPDVKLHDLLRGEISNKDMRLEETISNELFMELDQQPVNKDYELELDKVSIPLELSLNLDKKQRGADEELILNMEKTIESEERSKFRRMCASPVIEILLSKEGEHRAVKFFDCDHHSLYVKAAPQHMISEGRTEIIVNGKYYSHQIKLKFGGDLQILQKNDEAEYCKVSINQAQRASLVKLSAFLKLRKKIVYSFLKVARL